MDTLDEVALDDELEVIEDEIDETTAEFVDELVNKLVLFIEEFCDVSFFPYQVPIAKSIIESIVLGDGEEKTLIATRQSGKSEVVSNVIAGLMVILPRLSNVYPTWLKKFEKGFWVGVFAPTEDQADTVFGRVVTKLTSDHATSFLLDPDIDDKATAGGTRGKGKVLTLKKSGSLCRMQTCNPKAKIESKTYHFAFIDEAQEADETMITKSIKPMLAWNNGTVVLGGTAQRYKSYFYSAIQYNKRRDINARSSKRHHHEYDWKIAAKYNKNYASFIAKEKLRIGEDSDEFRLSYCNSWLLEKGMFVSEDRLDTLYDQSMPLVSEWWKTPVVVGIDVARSSDSTVVTVVWVDWDHPDPFGFYEHRVLEWHEINNVEWESQYFEIIDSFREALAEIMEDPDLSDEDKETLRENFEELIEDLEEGRRSPMDLFKPKAWDKDEEDDDDEDANDCDS